MLINELKYVIKLGLNNIWRNKLLSFTTCFVIAILVCIFNSIITVNFTVREALSKVNERVDIILLLRDNTTIFEGSNFKTYLENLRGVKKVEFVSKEKALEQISEIYPDTYNFFTRFNLKNPLPPSINVQTNSPESHQKIYNQILTSPYSELIDHTTDQSLKQTSLIGKISENLIKINDFSRQTIFWIVVIFFVGGTFIFINAIKLTIFYRRHEIFIARLVGASTMFIRIPFLVEGAFYGFTSVLLSLIFTWTISGFSIFGTNSVALLLPAQNTIQFIIFEFLITGLLGLISSLIATEQYLKTKLTVN